MRIFQSLFPFIRIFLRQYWRITRPLTAGARVMVLDEENRVLLVRHTYMPGWFLPGGGIERGETMKAGATRELFEEVGVQATGELSFFALYANFREFKSDHVALFVLRSFDLTPKPNREIAEFGFFAADNLPAGTTDATRARIREVLENQPAPEFWSIS